MKKLILAVVGILIATGCGKTSKTLNCSMNKDLSSNEIVQTIDATFNNNKMVSINMKYETKLDDIYVPYIDTFASSIEDEFIDYKDKVGIETNIEKKEQSVVFKMFVDIDKLDNQTKKELGFIETDESYDEAKKLLESKGYICK